MLHRKVEQSLFFVKCMLHRKIEQGLFYVIYMLHRKAKSEKLWRTSSTVAGTMAPFL